MSRIDWLVLVATLAFIVIYGSWRTRGSKNIEGYLLGDRQMKWWMICLSIMGTQASAITFLSTPGQAYQDGMRFIQFYLGIPIAMVIISITAVPIYNRLKVYTAYEYLEGRFDLKTRTFAALLFLIQRGLSTGITIYAPAIVLSTILGWNLTLTNIVIGGLVIVYTVSGGTRAVSVTQGFQMTVILLGMFTAGYMVVKLLPEHIHFKEAVQVAGSFGKMNIIDFSFNWNDRYNFWSGMLGGLFLFLSYFGTDQSQVARYLSGESLAASRMGLLFNGLLKIPMQFLILLLGSLVFVFYQFYQPPVFFNKLEVDRIKASVYAKEYAAIEAKHTQLFADKRQKVEALLQSVEHNDERKTKQIRQELLLSEIREKELKRNVTDLITKIDPAAAAIKDTDYVFITFIMDRLPHGLIGLLLAVMLCAAMSATASGLNALASTTCVDIYKRSFRKEASEAHYVTYSKFFTVGWGLVAIAFAIMAAMLENLIQAVNILGSLFYGTILGIFLAAFYVKYIRANAVFFAAFIAELCVVLGYIYTDIGFLWFNVIGCLLVVIFGLILQFFFFSKFVQKEV